jgi:AcrR family transcriptional regulator
MSKTLIRTKERIVSKALEMFNESGIEYVGLRELASTLDMRVSNITYYFPTKDDLVNHLSLDFSELNSRVIVENKDITLRSFLEMLRIVFNNQVTYRCLLLSFVHLMEQNKVIASRYKKTQGDRNAVLTSNLAMLVKQGYLKIEDESAIEFLVSSIGLISRFWISEAAISFRHWNTDQQIRHYLMLIVKLLSPYATAKGKKDLELFTRQLQEIT